MDNLSSTLGVDFQVKTFRVDERNIAVQLWDTAGQVYSLNCKRYFKCNHLIVNKKKNKKPAKIKGVSFLQERFRSVTKSYFRRADGVMLLYDVTNEHSFVAVKEWIEAVDVSYLKPITGFQA